MSRVGKLLSFILTCFSLLSIHATSIAQAAAKPSPKFTVSISLFPIGTTTDGQVLRSLIVIETNISNESIPEEGCWVERGVYHVSVLLDGHAVQERDATARKAREAKARATFCKEVPLNASMIRPGEDRSRIIPLSWDYPMSEPGTYEITVSRDSDPEHPDKNLPVTSNKLTIIVSPKPK